ncbi:MAG TPA: creatininase family protein [Bryobacteraceae bacterium]|jgi:creatinine amidohydrolase|nr:creatininase family protein [Bryobacteraceae bacterium]
MRLEYARWPDLAQLKERIFVIPLGSLEQHGPHLPVFTDSLIVSQVANRVEELKSADIALLPVQWLGHSPHHRRFGCVSLDFQPYVEMIRGICRSLIVLGARKILLLNGHGGNDIPCKAAQRELKSEFEEMRELYIVYATYWNLAAEEFTAIRSSPEGGMGHACEMETSVLLARHPDLVDMSKAESDGPGPEMGYRTIDMLKQPPFSLINEFDELSTSGVLGMPKLATAEKGARFLESAAQAVVRLLDEIAGWTFQER